DAAKFGLHLDVGAAGNVHVLGNFDFTFGIDLGGGLSGLDRFFIRPGTLHLSADVDVTDLNAGLSVGFLRAGIQNGSVHLNTEFELALNDPSGDGRITLDELISKDTNGKFAALQPPNVQGSGAAVLPIDVGALEDLLGIQLPAQPQIVASFDARLLPTPTFDVDFDVVGLDASFSSFKDFSRGPLLQLASSAVDLIRNSNFKLFNEPIPLLGKSVRELLAFTDQITAAFNNVSGQIQTLKADLLELLNGGPTVTGIKQVLEDAGF